MKKVFFVLSLVAIELTVSLFLNMSLEDDSDRHKAYTSPHASSPLMAMLLAKSGN